METSKTAHQFMENTLEVVVKHSRVSHGLLQKLGFPANIAQIVLQQQNKGMSVTTQQSRVAITAINAYE